jgi:hypothetical protein
MNRKTAIILSLTAAMVWVNCYARKKEVAYEFPKAMAAQVQAEFARICDKGQILYEINCARCHNIQESKKSIIPDFLPEQLISYELRVKNPKHENDLPETNISAEELGHIMPLTYKKRAGCL